ncbi:hypothetical protein [Williamsia serinedens]|uniref:Uncharacterized protein n=1 Tax=Williamsia serinedens TaxID=391736 RepID=A0ABT1H701_9NOCA|nr:hypothetical protein [Williamsia serinedens]MCP2163024.1 hypothetical protein [Williamsia serinedens]
MHETARRGDLLDYAVEHYHDHTLDPASIIDDLHITPDRFFTKLLGILNEHPPHVDDTTRRNLDTTARRYLWLHRC